MSNDAKVIYCGPSPRGWHRLQLAAECLQRYAWTYEVKLTPEEELARAEERKRPALMKGSLMHLALAQHYARIQQEQQGLSPDEYVPPLDAVELIGAMEGTPKDVIALVKQVYEIYRRTYASDSDRMQILAVEALHSCTIGGKYQFTGRLDLKYRDLAGRVIVCDHKTTGRVTASHRDYYAISGQMLGYSHLARLRHGEEYGGLMINLIEMSTKGKFERVKLDRSPHLEANFEKIVIDIEESIERIQAEGRNPEDWPKSITELVCFHRYGACDFLDQCKQGKRIQAGGVWQWED